MYRFVRTAVCGANTRPELIAASRFTYIVRGSKQHHDSIPVMGGEFIQHTAAPIRDLLSPTHPPMLFASSHVAVIVLFSVKAKLVDVGSGEIRTSMPKYYSYCCCTGSAAVHDTADAAQKLFALYFKAVKTLHHNTQQGRPTRLTEHAARHFSPPRKITRACSTAVTAVGSLSAHGLSLAVRDKLSGPP